jgi:DNA-binding NarL/FixJ family response regulator
VVAWIQASIDRLDHPEIRHAANENSPQSRQKQSANSFSLGSVSNPVSLLSALDAQVLLLLLAGMRNGEIADEVGSDHNAVKEHVKSILRKVRGRSKQPIDTAGQPR